MSQILKTALLALIAVGTSIGAAYFYPWPESVAQSERVGKLLFEDYEANRVRYIYLQRFNTSTGKLEKLEVRRKGDTWVLPGYKNFPASNVAQTTIVANALVEKEVLEEATDRAEDHREYGVIDPGLHESMPNRSALGTKLIFEDATGNTLANLIIGSRVKDTQPNERLEEQRFVNIPGQPAVYVINFNPRAISTDFRSWIDPNLFALPRDADVQQIEVENVRLDQEQLNAADPEKIYQLAVKLKPGENGQVGFQIDSLERGNQEGEWESVEPPASAPAAMQAMVQRLALILFSDVRKTAAEVAKLLETTKINSDFSALDPLKRYGIVATGVSDGDWPEYQFDSTAGELRIKFVDGVVLTMLIGNIATDATDQNELSRYVMFRGHFDESVLGPPPEKPEPSEDPAEADQQDKEYLRAVKEREEGIASARQFIASYNQQHADWVYLVPDAIISFLRPDLDLTAQ